MCYNTASVICFGFIDPFYFFFFWSLFYLFPLWSSLLPSFCLLQVLFVLRVRFFGARVLLSVFVFFSSEGGGNTLPDLSCLMRPLLLVVLTGRKSLNQEMSGSGLPLAAQSMVAVRVRSTTFNWGPMSMVGKPGGSWSSAETNKNHSGVQRKHDNEPPTLLLPLHSRVGEEKTKLLIQTESVDYRVSQLKRKYIREEIGERERDREKHAYFNFVNLSVALLHRLLFLHAVGFSTRILHTVRQTHCCEQTQNTYSATHILQIQGPYRSTEWSSRPRWIK